MKNKIAYLGFLGVFAFLGPFIPEAWFTFGFFFFFLYANVIPDELFILHVQKSAARAFFVGLIISVPLVIFSLTIENSAFIRLFLILSFGSSLLTFIINLEILERREKKVTQDGTYN